MRLDDFLAEVWHPRKNRSLRTNNSSRDAHFDHSLLFQRRFGGVTEVVDGAIRRDRRSVAQPPRRRSRRSSADRQVHQMQASPEKLEPWLLPAAASASFRHLRNDRRRLLPPGDRFTGQARTTSSILPLSDDSDDNIAHGGNIDRSPPQSSSRATRTTSNVTSAVSTAGRRR